MRKKSRKLATLFFAALMAGSALGGCGKKSNNNNENSSAPATSDKTVTESTETSTVTVNTPPSTDVAEEDVPVPAGYHLVWHDEFNGTELNPDDWNYELNPLPPSSYAVQNNKVLPYKSCLSLCRD